MCFCKIEVYVSNMYVIYMFKRIIFNIVYLYVGENYKCYYKKGIYI